MQRYKNNNINENLYETSGFLSNMMQNTINSDLLFVVNNFGGNLTNMTYLRPTNDFTCTLYSKLQYNLIKIKIFSYFYFMRPIFFF